MTVAVITLALVVLTLTGVVAWLARGWIAAERGLAAESADHVATKHDLERARFELASANKALTSATNDLAASQEAALDAPIPADALPAGDIDSRLLQAAQADAAGHDVHPGTAAGVHPPGAAAKPDAAGLPVLLDPDELLR